MSSLERAKARYAVDRDAAHRQAALHLSTPIGVDFHLSGWTGKAREALAAQWKSSYFDWAEIFRRHRDPDRLDMVIWAPEERLSGIGLGLTTGESVVVRFVEGDPRDDCPLKGRRIAIFLECAALYAQARGKLELRIQPINERLATLYQQSYGFTLATDQEGRAYYQRSI
jgi:hypothetical protein